MTANRTRGPRSGSAKGGGEGGGAHPKDMPPNIYRLHRNTEINRTVRTFVKWAAWCVIAYIGFTNLTPMIVVLAGKTTVVDVAVGFGARLLARLDVTMSWVTTFAAVTWAFTERKLRHRKIEQIQDHNRQLEMRMDPDRTSSGLTVQGKTHPQDVDR